MDRAEGIRQATIEARKACDMMWEAVLEELETRDPTAAHEAREVASAMHVRPLTGFSTRAAALSWGRLDYQARSDWLWICKTMREIWIRGAMECDTRGLIAETHAASLATLEQAPC